MKTCIVNYISGGGWRPLGQKRLHESLQRFGYKGDVLLFNERSLVCPSHKRTPYAFKLYALMEAYKKGYDMIIWLDASFWALRGVEELFDIIKDKNIAVQGSGFTVGQWTSDDCLKWMGIGREEAFGMVLFSGGLIGLNFRDNTILSFFHMFYDQAVAGGCFRGAWRNINHEVSNDMRVSGHRHDMSVGSILMHKMELSIFPNNTFFNYYQWHQDYKTKMDLSKVFFLCEGGKRRIAWNRCLRENNNG